MLSFGHMIPQAIDQMNSVGLKGTDALGYALVGYLVMFVVEKIAFDVHPDDSPLTADVAHIEPHTNSQSWLSLNSAKLLCVALSVHSFFEAASLGLTTDSTSAYMLSACIALHQPAESLALLVAFLKSGMPLKSVVLWLSGYSAVTLLGHGAGQLVNRHFSASFEAVIAAVTAGTEVRCFSFLSRHVVSVVK